MTFELLPVGTCNVGRATGMWTVTTTQLLVIFSHFLRCFSYQVSYSPVVADPATPFHYPVPAIPARLLYPIPSLVPQYIV